MDAERWEVRPTGPKGHLLQGQVGRNLVPADITRTRKRADGRRTERDERREGKRTGSPYANISEFAMVAVGAKKTTLLLRFRRL